MNDQRSGSLKTSHNCFPRTSIQFGSKSRSSSFTPKFSSSLWSLTITREHAINDQTLIRLIIKVFKLIENNMRLKNPSKTN